MAHCLLFQPHSCQWDLRRQGRYRINICSNMAWVTNPTVTLPMHLGLLGRLAECANNTACRARLAFFLVGPRPEIQEMDILAFRLAADYLRHPMGHPC